MGEHLSSKKLGVQVDLAMPETHIKAICSSEQQYMLFTRLTKAP